MSLWQSRVRRMRLPSLCEVLLTVRWLVRISNLSRQHVVMWTFFPNCRYVDIPELQSLLR